MHSLKASTLSWLLSWLFVGIEHLLELDLGLSLSRLRDFCCSLLLGWVRDWLEGGWKKSKKQRNLKRTVSQCFSAFCVIFQCQRCAQKYFFTTQTSTFSTAHANSHRVLILKCTTSKSIHQHWDLLSGQLCSLGLSYYYCCCFARGEFNPECHF